MEAWMKRTINREKIASRYLNEDREVVVFLPPGYNELQTYPVLYTQDGQDFFMMGRIATQANKMILDAEIQPLIIVGVTMNRSTRTAEYSPRGERNSAYRRFFIEELLPKVEGRYSIRQDRFGRVLAGDSLGATVSLDLIYDQPAYFSGLLSLSGAYFPENSDRIKTHKLTDDLNIYMLIGLEETTVETGSGIHNFLDVNRRTRDVMLAAGLNPTYFERPGGHDWGFWQKQLPEALKHFYAERSFGVWR